MALPYHTYLDPQLNSELLLLTSYILHTDFVDRYVGSLVTLLAVS